MVQILDFQLYFRISGKNYLLIHLTNSLINLIQIFKEVTKKDKLNPSQYSISLLNRGEGIKSKYIPPLLKWLDNNDKTKEFIWGIDEPENSLEFGLSDKLARLFFNDYSISNQIFLTSHSLAFIKPTRRHYC